MNAASNRARVADFMRQHAPNDQLLSAMPATIIGAGNKEICVLDATIKDLRHYRNVLEARVARRRRGARRSGGKA